MAELLIATWQPAHGGINHIHTYLGRTTAQTFFINIYNGYPDVKVYPGLKRLGYGFIVLWYKKGKFTVVPDKNAYRNNGYSYIDGKKFTFKRTWRPGMILENDQYPGYHMAFFIRASGNPCPTNDELQRFFQGDKNKFALTNIEQLEHAAQHDPDIAAIVSFIHSQRKWQNIKLIFGILSGVATIISILTGLPLILATISAIFSGISLVSLHKE